MAIYFKSADEVPLNGLRAGIAKDDSKNTEDGQNLPGGAVGQKNRKYGFERRVQTTKHLQGYSLPLTFFAGLVIGCVATNTSKKERDVYKELAPAADIAYKMKTTLLKANLLLQGMDTVIENTNKNFYLHEIK